MATGWGNKTWGAAEWGDLSNETVSLSGISATTSIGTSTTQANADVDVIGSQLTFTNAGAVAGASADVSLTGIQLTFSPGDEVIGIGVNVTGAQAATSIGTATVDETTLTGEGWGRAEWGSFAWGDNYSVQVNGISLTSSIGEETAFTDVAVDVTGSELTSTFANPSFSIQIDQDIFVLASEDQLDGFVGSLTLKADANVTVTSAGQLTGSIGTAEAGLLLEVPVTGIELTSTIGTIDLQQSTNEPATGQELTTSLGTAEEIPAQIVGVTGIELTGSVGSVTVVGTSVIQPTGILATISAGQVNITSWQEIDPGVNNVWSEVDLAA
jgi:hypothetical protein